MAYDDQSFQIGLLGFAKSVDKLNKGLFFPEPELARTPKEGKGLPMDLMTSLENFVVVAPSLAVLQRLSRYQR